MLHMCTYIYFKRCNIDAYLDASDNVISGNKPSSEMLTSQSKKPDEPKQGKRKHQDQSRSQEIKLIWT